MKIESSKKTIVWRISILVGFVALSIVGMIGYSLWKANGIALKYSSQIDATMMARCKATEAHLWFEEAIVRDT